MVLLLNYRFPGKEDWPCLYWIGVVDKFYLASICWNLAQKEFFTVAEEFLYMEKIEISSQPSGDSVMLYWLVAFSGEFLWVFFLQVFDAIFMNKNFEVKRQFAYVVHLNMKHQS